MPANKKKKKALGNPARGFATVSTPSKPKEPIDTASNDADRAEHEDSSLQETLRERATLDAQTTDVQHMTPEELEVHLENEELQNIVDSYSSRCHHDASRQVAKLQSERRQLRSQAPRLLTAAWLSDEFALDILQRRPLLDGRAIEALDLFDSTNTLLKLWTLRITLKLLQLPDIDAALKHILVIALRDRIVESSEYIWGLNEILEWYATEYPQEDLPDYEHGVTASLPQESDSFRTVPKPGDTESSPITDLQSKPPSAQDDLFSSADTSDEDFQPLSSSDTDNEDPTTFNERYIRLQSLLFEVEQKIKNRSKKSTQLEGRKSKITKRIDELRRDALFDTKEADAIWSIAFQDLQIAAAQAQRTKKPGRQDLTPNQEAAPAVEDDIELPDDLFATGEDETPPQAEQETQSTVRLIDFGKFTGTLPRRLVEDICRGLQADVSIRFATVTTTSYSSRQKVDLKWSKNCIFESFALSVVSSNLKYNTTTSSLYLEMESVATVTTLQAESYLAVHLIFLLMHSGYCDSKQYSRLPTVWRDLYLDLNQARKILLDDSEKEELKCLRHVCSQVRNELVSQEKVSHPDGERRTVSTRFRQELRKDREHVDGGQLPNQWSLKALSSRYQAMLVMRQQLPVHKFKSDILEAISTNQLTIICADTGAGKSTQVPSFILEHYHNQGHDFNILVTQPRRISAISLARRVSQELGEARQDLGTVKSLVGYAIRLESKTSRSTRITFATTGVLLRIFETSPDLEEIDCLILDEVHERTMDLDLLFIALKGLMQRRKSLKVVLMSATVDAEKFSSYFDAAPVLKIPGRTFPVQIRYLEDAIEDTISLNPSNYIIEHDSSDEEEHDNDIEGTEAGEARKNSLDSYSGKVRSILSQMDEYRINYPLTASLVEAIATREDLQKYSSAILIFLPGIAEIQRLHNEISARKAFSRGWIIHLLHSSFSTEALENAFAIPPNGCRKIVIATNIAETGITIPDVTAVIDTCKEKVMRFDDRRQLSRLTESFISRSSARQRRGRAARVQEGLCYHLVTRYRFENTMLEEHIPEMLRLSLQDPIMRVKVWNLGPIEETLAKALDPPTPKNIRRATEKLKDVGALTPGEDLTPLGKCIARLPLEVVLSKLAILGVVFSCTDATLTVIAALTSKSPFLMSKNHQQQSSMRSMFARGDSDLLSMLNAYQGWRKSKLAGLSSQFCRKHHLSEPALASIEEQKMQLLVYLVDAGLVDLEPNERARLNQRRGQAGRQNSFEIPDRFNHHGHDHMVCAVFAMAFYPKILFREGKGWRNVYTNQRVNLAMNSVNKFAEKPPQWLCFYEAMQTKSGTLNVLETSKLSEVAIIITLGLADFKFFSGVIVLDHGKMRFSVKQWRQMAAIKVLRKCLNDVLERCWQAPNLSVSSSDRQWIDAFASAVAGHDTRPR